jgi:hypothetical protein
MCLKWGSPVYTVQRVLLNHCGALSRSSMGESAIGHLGILAILLLRSELRELSDGARSPSAATIWAPDRP